MCVGVRDFAHEKPQLNRDSHILTFWWQSFFLTFIVSIDVPSPMHDLFTWARNDTFRPNQFVFIMYVLFKLYLHCFYSFYL